MNILVNGSGLKIGGGLQVADSICSELYKYRNHNFVVVLSSHLLNTFNKIKEYKNVECIIYNIPVKRIGMLLTGRDAFMDQLVDTHNVDVVFSFFGPSIWVPRKPHLSGFARAHVIMPESPYFKRMGVVERTKEKIFNYILKYFFSRSAKYFYSENEFISKRLENLLNGCKVFTISNYYNQVFDRPEEWVEHKLPSFKGCTLLTIAAPYPHKNLAIAIKISNYLIKKYQNFSFRFVFTINKEDFPHVDESIAEHFCFIGPVSIKECPSLYEQCDIAFQPTLLECFTATYPEAMRMKKPIITTSMEFAKGLCGNAAAYYSPLDYKEAAETIVRIASDKCFSENLVNKGGKQLLLFDNYVERVQKIIDILEIIYEKDNNGKQS